MKEELLRNGFESRKIEIHPPVPNLDTKGPRSTFSERNLLLYVGQVIRGKGVDVLLESLANFSFDQKDVAWTVMAYVTYLPPQTTWENRFGERTSFSDVVNILLRKDLNKESCAGTHILEALVCIEDADRIQPILDDFSRQRIDASVAELGEERDAVQSMGLLG